MMHEEFAMGSATDARAEEVAPYEPGGIEEKVGGEAVLLSWTALTVALDLHPQARYSIDSHHLVHVCYGK